MVIGGTPVWSELREEQGPSGPTQRLSRAGLGDAGGDRRTAHSPPSQRQLLPELPGTAADGRAGAVRYVHRLLPLAFLDPDIVTGIVEGRIKPSFTVTDLMNGVDLPSAWSEQRQVVVARRSSASD